MTWLRLAFANLLLSPLTSAVNILLLGLGTASTVLLLVGSAQIGDSLTRDARGLDLVLGAKGSPVQLVLSSIYHADVPTGNIALAEAERWSSDPRVKTSIPLALGDSFRGFRIVGTSIAYPEHYGAGLARGRWWEHPMEAVLGARAAARGGLDVGDAFVGVHGLGDSGHVHDARSYRVVGVLQPTGTVMDRLILTSVQSVWELHDPHDHDPDQDEAHGHDAYEAHDHGADRDHAHDHEADEAHAHGAADPDHDDARSSSAEITAMLLIYGTPLAAMTLPREINEGSMLQAAAPAFEISRLLQVIGIGIDGLRAFAWLLIATAVLSIFAALYGSLRSRRFDLATLRSLGATRFELLLSLWLEGLLLTGLGIALGFLLGHAGMELLGRWVESQRGIVLTGWTWLPAETTLLIGLLGVGMVAAGLPAWQAYRTDVARTLAER